MEQHAEPTADNNEQNSLASKYKLTGKINHVTSF